MNNSNKIESLEILRVIAFFGVFLSHTGIDVFKSLGYFGVSIFLMLSGFLTTYSNLINERKYDTNIKSCFKHAVKKIKPFYLLHIITMIAMIPFEIIGEKTNSIISIIISIITNVLLIQDWLPLSLRSLNGSSWYLCTLFFFYLIFPYVLVKIRKDNSINKAIKNIFVLILLKLLICLIGYSLINTYLRISILEFDITYWLVYHFPLSRILEVLIGCNLACIYVNAKNNKIQFNRIVKVALVLIIIFCIYISYLNIPTVILNNPIYDLNVHRWWNNSLVFIPSSISIILLFCFGRIKVTNSIIERFVSYFSNISKDAFLIHDDVFSYITAIIYKLPMCGIVFYYKYGGIIKLTMGMILTIICCELWKKIEPLISNIINKNNI